jgi:hypothetical protein
MDIDIDFALATNDGKDALRQRSRYRDEAFPAGLSGLQAML